MHIRPLVITTIIILGLVVAPEQITYQAPNWKVKPEVRAYVPPTPEFETLEEIIYRVAEEEGIPAQTLLNLATSESRLGELRNGDLENGEYKSCGVIHFHKDYYPEQNANCDDDEYIVREAAKIIAKGLEHRFVPCSCIAFSRALGLKLARYETASDIEANSSPVVGAGALFDYDGVGHVGVIISIESGGFWMREANLTPCLLTKRFVDWNDEHLRGFHMVK